MNQYEHASHCRKVIDPIAGHCTCTGSVLQSNRTEELKTEIVEYLSESEEQELEKLESEGIELSDTILKNVRRIGEILNLIKEKKLYTKMRRNKDAPVFSDFAEYAKHTFGKGKTMSYNYVAVYNVMKQMEDLGMDPMKLGSIQNTLQVHHELRRLTRVDERLNPLFREILAKGITLVENICPIDQNGELQATPEAIHAAFDTIKEIAITGHYDIDGDQHPISLGQIAVDDQASRMLYEEIQRRRLLASEDAHEKKTGMFKPKPSPNPVEPKKDYEEVFAICPRHGTVGADALLQGGIKLKCGCRSILQIINSGDSKKSALIWFEAEVELGR